MAVLQITIQRKAGDASPVVSEHSRSDSLSPIRREGELRLGDDERQRLLELELEPHAYGEVLGEALFSGRTREAFLQARSRDGDGLRVRLVVEDKELQPLYWGRLCAPADDDGWDFLTLDQRATFALYLPSSTDRAYRPIGQRDLRALLLVAEPEGLGSYGLAKFDAAATVASLRQALGEIPCEVLATVPGADGLPTLDELCRRLGDGQDTLLHVVAHGQVKDGETVLFLANERNQVERAAGEALIRELRRLAQLPHFIFLATCHSAQPKAGLGGLAQRLVTQLGVPAAVAMTEAVSIDTAGALAAAFYAQLRASGEPDVALARACAGLTRRPDITVPALYSRLGDRPLFGDTLDRELTPAEVAFGLDRLEALLPERAPVLVSDFKQSADRLCGMLSAGRENLAEAARPEWDKAWAAVSQTCDEVLDLNFRALALGREPPPYDARCPFPGLLAFGARYAASGRPEDDDRSFFFGREALVEQLERRLDEQLERKPDEHRFLPVLGPSGSGKSSVVLAGLVPRLQARGLRMVYMTPGSDPVANLEARLSGVSDSSQSILVIDQFEELFTLVDRDEQRRIFLERLLERAGRGPVVITMRADFLGDCAPHRNLAEALEGKLQLIAAMTTAELRSAMEQQARAVGLRFEADLSNTILDAVKDEPGAMPLLQHLLNELWQHRHGRWLLGSEYRAIGGIQQAIARTADRVYGELAPAERDQVRDIFLRMTRLDEDVVEGEERRDSRRRVAMEELIAPGRSYEDTKVLVKRLADSRLVVVSVNDVTGLEEVEVAHEALIRYWPLLRSWLDGDRELLRLREGIRRAAWDWQTSQRDDSYLVHRGKRLQSAQALLSHPRITLNQRETAYVQACLVAEAAALAGQKRETSNRRRLPEAEIRIFRRASRSERYPIALTVQEGLGSGTLRLDLPRLLRSPDPGSYGQVLGQALFGEAAIDGLFRGALAAAVEQGLALRVRLRLDPPELHALHWERAVVPGPDGPLPWGWSALTPFSRAMSAPTGAGKPFLPSAERPVRILVVVASPSGLEGFGLGPIGEGERAALRDALAGLPRASIDTLATGTAAAPTLEGLRQALETGYHLVHLHCHTGVTGIWERGILLLEGQDGAVAPTEASDLLALLKTSDAPPALWFLGAPGGGRRVPSENGTLSIARALVAGEGTQAAVALKYSVAQPAAGQAIGRFYAGLLAHGAADVALNEARAGIPDEWARAAPVLVSQLPDCQILEVTP